MLKNGQQTLLFILLGNVFLNITLAGLVHSLLTQYFALESELITLVVATSLIVVFGEIIPKNIALKHNEVVAKLIALPMAFLVSVFKPFLSIIKRINLFFLGYFRIHFRDPGPFVTVEELKSGIAKSIESGAVSIDEGSVINKLLEQGPLPVRKFMIHRSQLLVVNEDEHVSQVIEKMQIEQQCTALVQRTNRPLFITGIVGLPALFSADSQDVVMSISEPPVWAPESIEVAELIGFLLESGSDEACLLDEFGGFSGMFSASMAIQSIFSDVFQSDDKKVSSASITLRGAQRVEEVLDFLPDVLKARSGEYRTLNGVLCNYLGRIPKNGEAFAIGAFKFYIISAIPTRIEMVLIQKGENNDR